MRIAVPRYFFARAFLYAAAAGSVAAGSVVAHGETISFDRDVRPVLAEYCLGCHGPDPEARKAGLRLDDRASALASRDGDAAAVVPGGPEASELVRRILAQDPDDLMPPPSSGKALKPEQIKLLRDWIAEGADWPVHWAFVAPALPAVPETRDKRWPRNAIDNFVLARLEEDGVAPSPEAAPSTLLRRVSLDLTGLPPTLEEAEEFGAKEVDVAYGDAVERLLASPHYGEQWARHWLDAAQFADSDGFEKDKPREVWAWRDYVIDAFNSNKPYDQFVREQIAGDLMPNASQEERVATGFLRNTMTNEEGGIDPEEFRVGAVINRVEIIGSAILGLTLQCAQCHSHKYDPLSQTDYYRMFAFLNNGVEACMPVYSPQEQAQRAAVLDKIAAVYAEVKEKHLDWPARLEEWSATYQNAPQPHWEPATIDFHIKGQRFRALEDGSYLAEGFAPARYEQKMSVAGPYTSLTAVRLDLLTDPSLPRGGPGRSVFGGCAISEFELYLGPADGLYEDMAQWQRLEIASAISDLDGPARPNDPQFADEDGKVTKRVGGIGFAIDGDENTAWTTQTDPGRTNQPRFVIFRLKEAVDVPPGMKIGVRIAQQHGGWNIADNHTNSIGRFRISFTSSKEIPERALQVRVCGAFKKPEELFRLWVDDAPALAETHREVESLWQGYPLGHTQLVYEELPSPRVSHVLKRGEFLNLGEMVTPGVPDFLNPLPPGAPENRLGLAAWLTDRASPTTARAFVNRVWQHYFGNGICLTSADLGVQGEPPSHPELLDWLAVTFMESGWDVKALQRLIVSSATYRQSSHARPDLQETDPMNRLLARNARLRVGGETVRDIALAASGLLNPEIGGPGIHPPAPEFLFSPPESWGQKPWDVETDHERYRRGIYVYRFRSTLHPLLQAFDTPTGSSPCLRRQRSNTPVQALATLNEPMLLECAAGLAARTLSDGGATDRERIAFAYECCLGRAPAETELEALLGFLGRQRERIAQGLTVSADIFGGLLPRRTASLDEMTAWTLTSRVLLNLDETITRE